MSPLKHSLYFLVFICLITACKDDDSVAVSPEEAYFEDYEAPPVPWGFIDTLGNYVIEKKYDDLRPFEQGIARANYRGKWGFIDKKGNTIIPHQYRAVFPFKNGLARVQNFDKKYGFIDIKGKFIIQDSFNLVYDFNNGLARAKQGGNYGYINKNGQWSIPAFFKHCSNFEHGYARVKQYGKTALIDSTGKYKIPLEAGYDRIDFVDAKTLKVKKDKQYQLLRLRDLSPIGQPFDKIIGPNQAYYAVKKNGTWSIMTPTMKLVKTLDNIQGIKSSNAGLWIIKRDNQAGLISKEGKEILAPKYKSIFAYHEGFASFQVGEFWGYLDLNGRVAYPAILPIAWDFKNGYVRAVNQGFINYLDRNMELRIKNKFYDAHDFHEGLAHVQ